MKNKLNRLIPKKKKNSEYITWSMMVNFHGQEWADKWNKVAGAGNTIFLVVEKGKSVAGIHYEDYERFANAVDYGIPTYFD